MADSTKVIKRVPDVDDRPTAHVAVRGSSDVRSRRTAWRAAWRGNEPSFHQSWQLDSFTDRVAARYAH